MLKVEEAEEAIYSNLIKYPITIEDIFNCYGNILAEEIKADRDYPPFDRVAMDGIAINYKAFQEGKKTFSIQGTQKAGQAPLILKNDDYCIEVMTGCSLPVGCDCVIRVEDLFVNEKTVLLKENLELDFFKNIHCKGTDYKKDDKLISIGTELLMPQISVIASVGKKELLVTQNPSIAFVSTGDELVSIEAKNIQDYQIRMSNSYAMASSLSKNWGNKIKVFHIKDSIVDLNKELSKIMRKFDIVILSGGVSMGKFDYIPHVMEDLGVQQIFHKVAQKPGKPFWFGKTKDNKPIFGLPGNPVASMVCFYRYVLPYLYKVIDKKIDFKHTVLLSEELKTKKDLVSFLPVKILENGSKKFATTIKNNGSGDFYSLANADGFIEIEADKGILEKNTEVSFYSWKL